MQLVLLGVMNVVVFWPELTAGDAFTPLFNGKTLGNTKIFRVASGAIVGGTLKRRILHSEFLYTRRIYKYFGLRLKAKLVGER